MHVQTYQIWYWGAGGRHLKRRQENIVSLSSSHTNLCTHIQTHKHTLGMNQHSPSHVFGLMLLVLLQQCKLRNGGMEGGMKSWWRGWWDPFLLSSCSWGCQRWFSFHMSHYFRHTHTILPSHTVEQPAGVKCVDQTLEKAEVFRIKWDTQ